MKVMWVLYILMGNEQHFPPTLVVDHFDTKAQCDATLEAITQRVARDNGTNGEMACLTTYYYGGPND